MKTKKEVINEHPEYKTLINAVISRIGMKNVENVNNHGAGSGFNGFIYCDEAHRFAVRHRETIVQRLEDLAQDCGEDVISLVSGFGFFRRDGMDREDKKDLYCYLGGAKVQEGIITDLMACFALEEVCHMFED